MDQTKTGALIRAQRLPYLAHGTLLWYCTRDGLYYQHI